MVLKWQIDISRRGWISSTYSQETYISMGEKLRIDLLEFNSMPSRKLERLVRTRTQPHYITFTSTYHVVIFNYVQHFCYMLFLFEI